MAAALLIALQMLIGSGSATTASSAQSGYNQGGMPSYSQPAGIVVTDQSIVN